MRKILSSIMLVAVAAMASVSCQKEENAPVNETFSTTMLLNASVEQTKTYLGNDYTVLWGAEESVKLYVGYEEDVEGNIQESNKFFDSASTNANGQETASFSFTINDVSETGPYSLGGIYPASAAVDNTNPARFKVQLPATQQSVDGKYDPSAYIMVLKPEIVDALPTEYTASFRRATALNKITLTNVAEDITSVEITVPEDKYLAGRRYFDLTTGGSDEVYYDKSSTITVNSAFEGSSIDVWFCSWGVELAAGEELTIRMKSANSTYTRTITARESGIKFIEGDLNTLIISMKEATKEDASDFEGEWLITGTTSGTTYAAKAYSSGNNLSSPVQIAIADDSSITEVDGLDQCKMTFTKITEGDYVGMYTIQDAGGKYLYAASSSGNHLKGGSSADGANYYWTVECIDGAYSIVASKSSNRNVMQFNPNNGNPLFSCYTSASQTAVVLRPYSSVKPDTTPKIVIDGETTKNIGCDGGELTFNYTLKNLDGEALNVAVSDPEILSAAAAEGVLTVTVSENKGEARNATITLTCGKAEGVVLTVTQNKFVEPGVGVEETTVEMSNFTATAANIDEVISYTTATGGGTANPAINGGVIRLYQNQGGTGGGTITIKAADGYTLSSVTIGSSMSTSIAYTIEGSATKSQVSALSANGKYTVDDINASSITFYCMGTSSSSRLYVNYLSATYEAE